MGTLQGTITYPTLVKPENHRLKSAGWEKDMWSFPGKYSLKTTHRTDTAHPHTSIFEGFS